MTRQFCDACGTEIETNYVIDRLKGEYFQRHEGQRVRIQFEVTVGVGDGWNDGDLCRDCVIDAVNSLDTRPQSIDAMDRAK